MFEGIVASNSISFILVFLEGILSFFSPCVIPLIPVYMSYLAGGGKRVNEDGMIVYDRKKVFLNTMFFVLGISFAFFILGMSFTILGSFFSNNKLLFTRIGGIIIVILGLFQLEIFDFSFLQKERKIHIELTDKKMNPIIALIMGFTFSFAWTPCIGPALSSVLIMASGATTSLVGNLLVFVYAIGFLIPFLLLGIFTTQALNFIKSKQRLLKYTIKAGGIILIIMGIMIFTGWMNNVSAYLNSYSYNKQSSSQDISDKTDESESKNSSETESLDNNSDEENETSDQFPAFDFTLIDQNGNEHTLSDYKGKVVFLNFWATWCPPCKKEMPDIEALYNEYNLNQSEVVFLGIANPRSEEYPNNQDGEKEEIKTFLHDNGYTFPTLFDETGEVLQNYNISAFPTTFMIDKKGNIFGYVPGMMTKDIMVNIINQTLQSTE
ncbi:MULTISPECIES: redoxin family protein [unclassified Sedimentibacter]|uniref:redoxin family protein n=1 Tax=unclassified Sedimentibacter TaxID=2649220 RepID=UPI0027E1C6EE|nr:cytochrome c biogenesis protein CcdA [Sedimentibacter sp. MB35-C1]WMJ77533.1 cytochrome c biogenesis protein CcdA [Sedimentibacter sp. MB35-C1]